MNKKDTPLLRVLKKKAETIEKSFYYYLRLTEKTVIEHDLDWQHEMLFFYVGYLRELEAHLRIAQQNAPRFPSHPRRLTHRVD